MTSTPGSTTRNSITARILVPIHHRFCVPTIRVPIVPPIPKKSGWFICFNPIISDVQSQARYPLRISPPPPVLHIDPANLFTWGFKYYF